MNTILKFRQNLDQLLRRRRIEQYLASSEDILELESRIAQLGALEKAGGDARIWGISRTYDGPSIH